MNKQSGLSSLLGVKGLCFSIDLSKMVDFGATISTMSEKRNKASKWKFKEVFLEEFVREKAHFWDVLDTFYLNKTLKICLYYLSMPIKKR